MNEFSSKYSIGDEVCFVDLFHVRVGKITQISFTDKKVRYGIEPIDANMQENNYDIQFVDATNILYLLERD